MRDPLEKPADGPYPGASICVACGRSFECGSRAGAASCWCAELPARLPVPGASAGCYCRRCLERLLAAVGR